MTDFEAAIVVDCTPEELEQVCAAIKAKGGQDLLELFDAKVKQVSIKSGQRRRALLVEALEALDVGYDCIVDRGTFDVSPAPEMPALIKTYKADRRNYVATLRGRSSRSVQHSRSRVDEAAKRRRKRAKKARKKNRRR